MTDPRNPHDEAEPESPHPQADITTDDEEFGNEHPLASPGELAGTAGQAIARELEALGPDEEDGEPRD